ncbi:HTH-type transcriptional repressor of iron proteins A [Delftia tsuruhatensis]|uniref:AraC family transcriptional regulator n=1 Tax=Delftia tsuruhatensis TaxID=180282 RepID=UPI001E7E2097|nr:helix-turn-helix transcriptional regulator [Delftia tsuruhatensis]CAB5681948.1 HTH-type transcriptional repressor of iron proteins A [Delftia tsuruhatensis]CAC9675736.1 HTH-type transcriptional repressor of iron proteins A [Delftia tsuruhatensis]
MNAVDSALLKVLPAPWDPDHVDRPVTVLPMRSGPGHWGMDFHAHRKSQLMVTNTGLITLETDAGVCVVPPRSAAWIQGGTLHRVSCSGAASGYIVFVEAGAARPMPGPCHALAVSPFLRALLDRVQDLPQDYALDGGDGRLMQVLLDEIQAAQPEGLHLPLPHDRRLRRMTSALCAEPQLHARLADWAQRIGMSERSMTRLFVAETGLTVNQWRRQLHVLTALQQLSQGLRIQTVADALGYESAPAFVTMFRKAVGTSPRRFLAMRSAPARTAKA